MMMSLAEHTLIALLQRLERAAKIAARLAYSALSYEGLELGAPLRLEIARALPVARVDRALDLIGEI